MPIGLEQWRMQIGVLEAQRYRYLSRASRKAARGGRVRVGRVSGGCLVGIVLCVTLLCLATSFSMRLLLAGDVERNPGPLPDELLSATDNSELAVDDLLAVYKEVCSLAGRWRAMCLSLGLSHSEMETTAATYPSNPHDCFREVILIWLKKAYNFQRYGPPTWRMLVEAVADPAGGNNPALAEKVAKAHQAAVVSSPTPSSVQAAVGSSGHITTSAHQQQQLDPQETHDQVVSPPTPGSPQAVGSPVHTTTAAQQQQQPDPQETHYLGHLVSNRDTFIEDGSHASSSGLVTDKEYHPTSETGSTTEENQFQYPEKTALSQEEKDTLMGRLQEESMQIMLKFQGLVDTFRESLEHRKVPVESLASRLSSLGAFTAVKPQRPLLEDCLPQIINAPTISVALWNLRHYFSFFNYHVIEHIINGIGTDDDKSNLQKYKEDLKQYSKRRCYECHSWLVQPSDVGKKLILKLDVSFKFYSVEELQMFKCRLSGILQITEGALTLRYIEDGCIQLTFRIPSFMEKEIFPLSHAQETALTDEGVLDLRCGEYEFSAEAWKSANSCTSLSMSQSSRRAAEGSPVSIQVTSAAEIPESTEKEKTKPIEVESKQHIADQKKLRIQIQTALQHQPTQTQEQSMMQTDLERIPVLEAEVIVERKAKEELEQKLAESRSQVKQMEQMLLASQRTIEELAKENKELQSELEKLRKEKEHAVRGHKMVKEVSCNSEVRGHEEVHQLPEWFRQVNGYQLRLSGITISNWEAYALGDDLCKNRTLAILKIDNVIISDEGLSAIAHALHKNQSLKSLSIDNVRISDEGLSAIARALHENQSLTSMSLWNTEMSDSAAYALGEALRVNKTLVKLNLNNTNTSDNGAGALANALQENKTLKELQLKKTRTSDIAASKLASALRENQTLEILNLGYTNISDSGISALAGAISVNKALEILEIDFHAVGDKVAIEFVTAAGANSSLKELWICNSRHVSEESKKMLEQLRKNVRLYYIN